MLAACDANYKFIMVDIGAPGRRSDGGVFRSSDMGIKFFNQQMNLPAPTKINNNGPLLPYYLVGDEGFPLTKFLMRPYPRRHNLSTTQKVFNYRLSRARRNIECSFEIFVQRFRIFRKPIIAKTETVKKIVKTAFCLHNFILNNEEKPQPNDDNFVTNMFNLSQTRGFRRLAPDNDLFDLSVDSAVKTREELAKYLMYFGEGSVKWQFNKIRHL